MTVATSLPSLLEHTATAVDMAATDDDYGDRYRLRGSISVLRVALDGLEARMGVNGTPQPHTPPKPPPPPPPPPER